MFPQANGIMKCTLKLWAGLLLLCLKMREDSISKDEKLKVAQVSPGLGPDGQE
jgi:hypothetical protein